MESDATKLLNEIFATLPGGIDKYLATNFSWQTDLLPNKDAGKEELQTFLDQLRHGFEGYTAQLTQAIPRERLVACEFYFEGVHSGWYPNLGAPDPRGPRQRVVLTGAGFAEVQGEQLISLTTYWNCAHALAQLGVRSHMRPDPAPLEQAARQTSS